LATASISQGPKNRLNNSIRMKCARNLHQYSTLSKHCSSAF